MDQAEKLREIIKKQNQSNESSARIITVTSGKGGVGKSNMSVNDRVKELLYLMQISDLPILRSCLV